MAWTLHHHLAKIKLQASMYNRLVLQFDFRLVHTQLWTKWNDLMGLYTPMHTCITHCQFWKLIWKVQISHDPAINRAPYAQNITHIRASYDPKPLTLSFQRIILRISLEIEFEFSLFWDSKLQGSKTFCAFHSTSASILSAIKHKPKQEQLNPDLHWRYFPEILNSSILSNSCSIQLILWLSEVLPM